MRIKESRVRHYSNFKIFMQCHLPFCTKQPLKCQVSRIKRAPDRNHNMPFDLKLFKYQLGMHWLYRMWIYSKNTWTIVEESKMCQIKVTLDPRPPPHIPLHLKNCAKILMCLKDLILASFSCLSASDFFSFSPLLWLPAKSVISFFTPRSLQCCN